MKAFFAYAILLVSSMPVAAQEAASLDRFVGFYQLKPDIVVSFTRNGDHLFAQGSGQPAIQLSTDGPNKFTASQGQWRFEEDAAGEIVDVVLTQHGSESKAPRIGATQARAIIAAQEALVKANKPSGGAEDALRLQISAFQKGTPDYDAMASPLASVVRKNAEMAIALIRKQGVLKSLKFRNVLPGGGNVYDAEFEHGSMEWVIAPLTPEGKIDHLAFKPVGAR
ncbi:MAG TPA: hypothetical protein VJS85_06530 [Rhizomicrobium sp.]|nr:hypothetical protein [Rhizomicrobium sp.]